MNEVLALIKYLMVKNHESISVLNEAFLCINRKLLIDRMILIFHVRIEISKFRVI